MEAAAMGKSSDTFCVRVSCYAGYRGEQRPLRFYLHTRSIEVVEIIDQWYGPDYRYCKLRGDDNNIYILRHRVNEESWELTFFNRGSLKPPAHRLPREEKQ